jgi:hypothetical protein
MYVRHYDPVVRLFGVPVTAAVVLVASFTATPILVMGIAAAVLVALKTVLRLREQSA